MDDLHITYGMGTMGGVRWSRRLEELLRLGHGDAGTFGIVEAVHGEQLHDHVQAVGENQHHEQAGQQAHPDPGGEEPRAVAGVRELAADQVEALDLVQE